MRPRSAVQSFKPLALRKTSGEPGCAQPRTGRHRRSGLAQKDRADGLDVLAQVSGGDFADGDNPVFPALALQDAQCPCRQVHVIEREAAEFAAPQARRVQDFEHGSIAEAQRRGHERLAQGQLGNMVHVTQQVIAEYEAGYRNIPVYRLVSLAEALGVTADELLKDSESGTRKRGQRHASNSLPIR